MRLRLMTYRARSISPYATALASLAGDLGVGTLTLRGVLAALAAPGADDRAAADPQALLRTSAVSAADLKPGDVLQGLVRNVARGLMRPSPRPRLNLLLLFRVSV